MFGPVVGFLDVIQAYEQCQSEIQNFDELHLEDKRKLVLNRAGRIDDQLLQNLCWPTTSERPNAPIFAG